MLTTQYIRFALRSYTAAQFTAMNDILLDRELGVEYDTGRIKRGDGSTPWNDLGYEVLGLGDFDWSATKATPVDGDQLLMLDSAASNGLTKMTWASLKSILGLRPKGVVALTDAATIAVDASLGDNFRVVLAGNRTLGNPTNLTDGQTFNIRIKQDGTGSRTLAYGTNYKFPSGVAPVLSTTANAVDFLSCQYDATAGTVFAVMNKAFA